MIVRLSAFEAWMATRIALNIEGEYPPDISELIKYRKKECRSKVHVSLQAKWGEFSSRNSGYYKSVSKMRIPTEEFTVH